MPKDERQRARDTRIAKLRRQGFNVEVGEENDGRVRVTCNQCVAMVINGVACHERGCPAASRKGA